MTIAASILPEFDQEMKSARAVIGLVGDSIATWRPHEKSWTAGELARHIANLPVWVKITLEGTEFDLDAPRADSRPAFESSAVTVAALDQNVADARGVIEATADADMMVGWSLKSGDHTIFTMPRVAVLRSFVMNHLIHHRGQLTVYLRMNDIALPEIYGPTADSAAG